MASWFATSLLRALDEKRAHNPYQNEPELGPGPKGGWRRGGQPFRGGQRTTVTRETGRFDCQCRRGTCQCRDTETGRVLKVGKVLNRRAKAQYNRAYKAWRRELKAEAQKKKKKEKES